MKQGIRIVNWNVEWRQRQISEILTQLAPDIICLTEARPQNIPFAPEHILTSQPSGNDAESQGARKVVLWSRWGWAKVDTLGAPTLPEGRFVAAQTTPPNDQPLTIIGVVIPYRFYRTEIRWNEARQRAWQGAEQYLATLAELLAQHRQRTVVIGDFNLEIPRRRRTPIQLDLLRQKAFDGWAIPTSGSPKAWPLYYADSPNTLAKFGPTSIDHLAHTPDLTTTDIWRWCRYQADGTRLSDHDGMLVTLTDGD